MAKQEIEEAVVGSNNERHMRPVKNEGNGVQEVIDGEQTICCNDKRED